MSDKGRNSIDRRRFLQQGLGAAAASLAGVTAPVSLGQDQSSKPVRIGIVGVGPRGVSHVKNFLTNHPDVTISAICDILEDRLKAAIKMVEDARGKSPAGYGKDEHDYRNMCQREDVDAVLAATGVDWLGPITIDALRAGKHAAMEVSGPQTEEECWDMVREKQKSGKRVMLLENGSYGDDNLMMYNMAKQGVLGEPYFAEGSYQHDGRTRWFDSNGKTTWRGNLAIDRYGSTYPQHGFGSCAKWLGINDGDRLEYCQTVMSSPREAHLSMVRQYGPDSVEAKTHFKQGDFITSVVTTVQGRVIRNDWSASNTRPYTRNYTLQGTKGCWDSRSGIFLPGADVLDTRTLASLPWEPLDSYRQKYRHPYWREKGEIALTAGHGGADYFCIGDFVKMVREDREPWIDVYDCAAWSSVIFCSKLSLDRKGARVEMPDFTGGKWKDPNWRKDRMPVG